MEAVENAVLMHGYGLVENEFKPEKYQADPPLTEEERSKILLAAETQVFVHLSNHGQLDGFEAAWLVRTLVDACLAARGQKKERKVYSPEVWRITRKEFLQTDQRKETITL